MAAPKPARIVNRMPQFVTAVEQRAARGITAALVRGGSELPALVPVDTSTLLNSHYRDVSKEGSRIVGRVGFTAEYALAVHEAEGKLKGQPRPPRDGVPRGNYWGPHDGQPRYLALAFERASADIKAILKGVLKV